jgi:hypothetical protein
MSLVRLIPALACYLTHGVLRPGDEREDDADGQGYTYPSRAASRLQDITMICWRQSTATKQRISQARGSQQEGQLFISSLLMESKPEMSSIISFRNTTSLDATVKMYLLSFSGNAIS